MTTTSNWTKTYEHTVDQRETELPPSWLSTHSTASAGDELGQAVHIIGRKRKVAERLADLLSRARDMAVVSSFLLADEGTELALLEAAKRGVRVYVMLATEARLGKEDSDGEFDNHVLSEHKKMLQRLAGHVLFRSAQHFHAKVVIIDPHTAPQGMLLTANLTEAALSRNEELAVDLTADEARHAAELLGWAMWETAEHEMLDPRDRLRAVKPMGSFEHPDVPLPATTPERTELRWQALEVIDSAERELMVASFGWDADHPVVQQLCKRAEAGVNVTVLARVRPSSMPALLKLQEAGATVYGFKWLHAKAIWADSGRALVMSANLQRDGLDKGFELGVHLTGERASELHTRLRDWASAAKWKLEHQSRLGDVLGDAKIWQNGGFTDITVVPSMPLTLADRTAASADNLVADRPPLPNMDLLQRPAHELVCTWNVKAPTLHKKAKEKFRPTEKGKGKESYQPAVYKVNSGLVVAIKHPEELDAALALKEELSASAIVLK